MSRVIPLQGVRNFRSFGGYETASGARVRGGLYRSGHFARATGGDLAALEALNLAVVADLRRPREREREPSPWDGERPRVLASDFAGAEEPPHIAFLREGDLSEGGIRNFMLSTYRRLTRDPGNRAVFAAGLRSLAEHDESEGFVVHCAAGKDRTGIFCALALEIAGAPRETVMEDYLLTNTAVDFGPVVDDVRAQVEAAFGRKVPAREMRIFLGVDADYLATAFDEIGSAEAYAKALGLTEAEIAAVRRNLAGA